MVDVADQVLGLLLNRLSRAEARASLGEVPPGARQAPAIQTRFGNSVLLKGAVGGQEVLRLLDCSLEQANPAEQYRAGAWVLSLTAYNNSFDVMGNPTAATNDVVARITIGAGGAAIPFEVSVLQGTDLQLPASTISVDVRLTGSGSADMRVLGVIQRGFATQGAVLKQTWTSTDAVLQNFILPNFARAVRIAMPTVHPFYAHSVRYAFGNAQISGPEMRRVVLNGDWFLTGIGRIWQILTKPATTEVNYPLVGTVEWQIVL